MRTVIRTLLLVGLLLVAVVFVLSWTGTPIPFSTTEPARSVGTSGATATEKARQAGAEIGEKTAIATEKARQAGAEIGEKAAVATEKVRDTMSEAALTAKIKAKMALDDTVKARAIDVTTNGSVVTVSGSVETVKEHDRAIALARETSGVTAVIDALGVRLK